MEKQHQTKNICHGLIITFIISLSIASFALCIVCESKKSENELRIDGDLCFLPQSQAFGYGIVALVCSSFAQIIGTGFFILRRRSIDIKNSKTSYASILIFSSWIIFLISLILAGTAISMNKKQKYGEGWVGGTCYLVKNGIFVGSGILVLIAMISTLCSYLLFNKSTVVHAQLK
ncbi:protein MODIFYING WALL LIGNIN-1-like [Rutidosis leptorrhynchoides]|uniref:protein MODIFYING WALL LIGNIN-1-like n=1 Tax=Rutidosis leptorrhynchoides TaxID=125765 RepID=UPI003A99E708